MGTSMGGMPCQGGMSASIGASTGAMVGIGGMGASMGEYMLQWV
jgi:hypothetical protein